MKSMSQLQTVSDIKGARSIGARSIPKSMRSSYLELYVLDREMSRLEKEMFSLDKRRKRTRARLDSVVQSMDELKKRIDRETVINPLRRASARKPLKTISIKY